MSGDIVERTARAQVQEILRSPFAGRPAKTIFFGGGTPTFYSSDQLTAILNAVRAVHPPVDWCEITTEANPGTVDAEKFEALRAAGFNRISLGAQSFVPEDLIRLGRVHGSQEVGRAVAAARRAGFENINLDLMFGLPGQREKAWQQNVGLALELKPEHLSLYCLTIEPNTRFYKLNLRGMLDLPQDDVQVEMYNFAHSKMVESGYQHYEISNFCLPGRECQHNLAYWRSQEYAGYGPGAVGTVDRHRTTVQKHPLRYCEAVENAAPFAAPDGIWCEKEQLTSENLYLERVMMGLRLSEGLPMGGLATPEKILGRLESRSWIRRDDDRLYLTDAGRHFCSEVALELVSDSEARATLR